MKERLSLVIRLLNSHHLDQSFCSWPMINNHFIAAIGHALTYKYFTSEYIIQAISSRAALRDSFH
jgi:hypothetical protein